MRTKKMKSLLCIQSWAGARDKVHWLWPSLKMSGLDILGTCPVNSQHDWPADCNYVHNIGEEGWLNPVFLIRWVKLWEVLISDPKYSKYDAFLVTPFDVMFLKPAPEHPGGLVTAMAGGKLNLGEKASRFFHPPWWADRDVAKIIVEHGNELIRNNQWELYAPDVFLGRIIEDRKIPYHDCNLHYAKTFGSGIYSVNSGMMDGHMNHAIDAVKNGVWFIHGIVSLNQMSTLLSVSPNNNNVLFFNSVEPECSVHNMGLNLYRVLTTSKKYQYHYYEPHNINEFIAEIARVSPIAVIFNHMPNIQSWVNDDLIMAAKRYTKRIIAFMTHGATPVNAFDTYIIPDPLFPCPPKWHVMGRPLPKPVIPGKKGKIPMIGTAGFLLPHKDFRTLVIKVCESFDNAIIRMAISSAHFCAVSESDIDREIEICKQLSKQHAKGEVEIQVDRQYRTPEERVKWLSKNDLNVYIYKDIGGMPATSTDLALSARKPIAVNRVNLFKLFHECSPSVCIEDNSLKTIMDNGIAPLASLYERFSDERILVEVERVIQS